MSPRIVQLPQALDLEWVSGDPFTLTVVCSGATVANASVSMLTAGGDVITSNPGVPTVTTVGSSITIAWTAVDSAALNSSSRTKNFRWSLEAEVDGAGPFQLLARRVTIHPVGSGFSVASDSVSLVIAVGMSTADLAITVGGAGASTLDDLTDVSIASAASGDILRYDGTAWVDTPGASHFDPAGTAVAAVAAHESDSTNVHGIPDTSTLVTTTTAPELIRDTMAAALTAGPGVTITPNDGADTITIAAGAGLKTARHPTGGYVIPGFAFVSHNSTLALAANSAVIRPVPVASSVTLTAVGVEVTATGTATAMRVGVYSLSDASDYFSTPTLVSDLGVIDVSTTGAKALTSLSVSLPAARYLVLLLANGSVTLRAPIGNPVDLFTSGVGATGYFSAWTGGTITYGALPSTFTPSPGPAANNNMNYPVFFQWTVT